MVFLLLVLLVLPDVWGENCAAWVCEEVKVASEGRRKRLPHDDSITVSC